MSTRSRIAFDFGNGNVDSIYCHYDGYPDGVGSILYFYYNDAERARVLCQCGNISVLKSDLCSSSKIDDDEPYKFNSLEDLLDYFKESDQEYLYVYNVKKKSWYYYEKQTININDDFKSFVVYSGKLEDYFNGK